MLTLGRRVALRREELNIKTQEALAALVRRQGVPMKQQTIAKIENDGTRRPRNLMEVARALKTTEEWLLYGKGAKELDSISVTARVSIIGQVQAGVFREAMEWPQEDWQEIHVPVPERFPHVRRFALKVCGPSMNRIYPDGATVVFLPWREVGVEPKTGQRLVVVRRSTEGVEATIKELEIKDDGAFWLWPRSDDPNYQAPWPVRSLVNTDDNDDISILGLIEAGYVPSTI